MQMSQSDSQCCDDRLVREDDRWVEDPKFLKEVFFTSFERRRFQTEAINLMPLYPTEAVLWDENQVPSTHYTGAPITSAPSQVSALVTSVKRCKQLTSLDLSFCTVRHSVK